MKAAKLTEHPSFRLMRQTDVQNVWHMQMPRWLFSDPRYADTVDNGSEFSAFSQVENWGCAVYFAHPYTSWERPQNERHNGLFRTFVPKGMSIEAFSAEYILAAADELNGRPRKKLGYRTPEELFDEFLDSVYAAEGCGSIAQDGSLRLPS